MPTGVISLENYRVVAWRREDTPHRCDVCGTTIKIVVTVNATPDADPTLPRMMEIGQDCAQKCGIPAAEIKAARRSADHKGDVRRFIAGCSCDRCWDAVAATPGYRVRENAVLTGPDGTTVDDVRRVTTKYGERFRSDRLNVWLPVDPDALAAKGYELARSRVAEQARQSKFPGGRPWWVTVRTGTLP